MKNLKALVVISFQGLQTKAFKWQCQYSSCGKLEVDQRKVCELF